MLGMITGVACSVLLVSSSLAAVCMAPQGPGQLLYHNHAETTFRPPDLTS